ncbi:MAG: NUDIX domain-containing protein [Clostridia bacterium]|nr:NUDIX domain-containing protein [Clostridia bacterium]
MELLDVCDEYGRPTGEVVERARAHRAGVCHRTAHTWLYRMNGGRYEVLLQKRSDEKESYPGMLDTSCAGHVPAGEAALAAAVRELREELGFDVRPERLTCLGMFRSRDDLVFHEAPFRDNECCFVYACEASVEPAAFRLQRDEVAGVEWRDLEEVLRRAPVQRDVYCIPIEGIRMLHRYLIGPDDAAAERRKG